MSACIHHFSIRYCRRLGCDVLLLTRGCDTMAYKIYDDFFLFKHPDRDLYSHFSHTFSNISSIPKTKIQKNEKDHKTWSLYTKHRSTTTSSIYKADSVASVYAHFKINNKKNTWKFVCEKRIT